MKCGENQVPGERGIDRDARGFQVANFANHDHIGRLAQDRTQGGREAQSHQIIDLHLVDAGQQVFDRVLDRDDLAVGAIDEVQTGVKGGGFAGAGGPGDQQDAVGQPDHALEGLLVIREEAQFRQAQAQPFLVQNTHDDAFAVIGRQARDTKVD